MAWLSSVLFNQGIGKKFSCSKVRHNYEFLPAFIFDITHRMAAKEKNKICASERIRFIFFLIYLGAFEEFENTWEIWLDFGYMILNIEYVSVNYEQNFVLKLKKNLIIFIELILSFISSIVKYIKKCQ